MIGHKDKHLVTGLIIVSLMLIQLLFAWERYYGTEDDDYGRSVRQTWDGYVIGGTTRYSEDHWDAYLVNIYENGDVSWEHNYGIPDSLEIIHSAAQYVGDGGIIAIGEAWDPSAGITRLARGFIVKTNYDGNEIWRFHRIEGASYRSFTSFIFVPDEDSIAVTGWAMGTL